MFTQKIKPKIPQPYFVNWIIWNRDKPVWRAICKFSRCTTQEKAERLKANLLKQTRFIEVHITKII